MKAALSLAVLLLAAPISAEPITFGSWSATPEPSLDTDRSEDCSTCAVRWLLPSGTEMLSESAFGYRDWRGGELVAWLTDYTDGSLSYDGAAFFYDNRHGAAFNSGDGFHFRLFRRTFADRIDYYLAVEDLQAPIIPDWNDLVIRWTEPIACVDCEPPPSEEGDVPEPSALALLLAGSATAATRWRRR
jgi:hypothetical protein